MEREDSLDPADVKNQLCIMVITLQSFNVSKKSKDARKIFNDSGQYGSFFPAVDDYNANNALLSKVPNLVEADLLERDVMRGIVIKHSLGNVFRLCRPIVIIDEEHKAKSQPAIQNINDFNPKFILEFSATPRDHSNTLVDIGGLALKQEQMIKLPIHVDSSQQRNWQTTLNAAHAKLEQLSADAATLQGMNGVYIRPIMVIIAQANMKNDSYDHVEEIKQYLIDKCQIYAGQIRIKLSGKDEIKDDDLMDELCQVQYIITKDALREGWDCPFASILTVLRQANSVQALTQYVGRVLRQPYAALTPVDSLNQAYVYCSRQAVGDAVMAIKQGLEKEGMGDITHSVTPKEGAGEDHAARQKQTIRRHKDYKDKIFLPTLSAILPNGKILKFDYYRDILGYIEWDGYHCEKLPILANRDHIDVHTKRVDYNDRGINEFDFRDYHVDIEDDSVSLEINYALLTSQLTDKIPNPFQAMRVLRCIVERLKAQGMTTKAIALSGHEIVKQIKDDALQWLLAESEKLFIQRLKDNEISLKLLAAPHNALNWEMGDDRIIYKNADEAAANDWNKNLFQPQFKSNYNGLERQVAAYINQSEAVKWWHRLGVKGTEYAVQGWKRGKIYPDFLIYDQGGKFYFLEIKGDHLENPDSQYKEKVFKYLTSHSNKIIGEFKLISDQTEMSFDLIYARDWEEKLVINGF